MYNSIVLLQESPGGFDVVSFLPILLIVVVFYFFIIRPQQKRQKDRQKLLSSVKKGDKIITAGGLHGTVEGITDATLLVRVSDNMKVTLERSSVSTIVGLTDNQPSRK